MPEPFSRRDSWTFSSATRTVITASGDGRGSPTGIAILGSPIPEDRDQAFIDFDGFAMALVRRAIPIQIRFKDTYPNLVGLTMTGWELDREFLAELDRTAWDAVVAEFREDLPDPVIEDAVRRLPPPYYKGVGEALARTLKSRRDALPDFADRYYELITRQAEILATDRDEYLHCEHLQNGDLVVRIGLAEGPGGERTVPYFERTFHAEENAGGPHSPPGGRRQRGGIGDERTDFRSHRWWRRG